MPLYIVSTPIGNLGDMGERAVETLRNAEVIAAEDTRHSQTLFSRYAIRARVVSYHDHNKYERTRELMPFLRNGKAVAVISDAGTPGVSDPGQRLIKAAKDFAEIIPIPGPSAVASAVSVSGMVEKEFYFAGFLPKKNGRQTKFRELSALNVPIVIYESALRLPRTLNDIKEYFGDDTEVFIAREMTKMFEEYWGGSIIDIINDLKSHKLKGEVTLIVKKLF